MMTASQRMAAAIHQMDATHALIFDNQRRDFGLLDMEVGFALQNLLHPDAILLLVALRPRRPDGGTAAGVQQPELDSHRVGDLAHHPAERVDLPNQVAFGDPADRRIAGHLRDQVGVHGDHGGTQTEAGAGSRGLAAGVAAANDHDVVRELSPLLTL